MPSESGAYADVNRAAAGGFLRDDRESQRWRNCFRIRVLSRWLPGVGVCRRPLVTESSWSGVTVGDTDKTADVKQQATQQSTLSIRVRLAAELRSNQLSRDQTGSFLASQIMRRSHGLGSYLAVGLSWRRRSDRMSGSSLLEYQVLPGRERTSADMA